MSTEVETYKPKSFWSRPEGKLGATVLLCGAAAIGLMHNPIVAFFRSLFDSQFSTMGLFAALGAVCLVATDSRARKLVGYVFKGLMRKITGLFVQLDPIKNLESYIEYLKKNREEMNTNIQKLRGQLSKLRSIVSQNQNEMDQNIRIARQAKLQNRAELIAVNTRQYGRLKRAQRQIRNHDRQDERALQRSHEDLHQHCLHDSRHRKRGAPAQTGGYCHHERILCHETRHEHYQRRPRPQDDVRHGKRGSRQRCLRQNR